METKYFKNELAKGGVLTCPCGCGATLSQDTVNKLDKTRDLYGKPVFVEQGGTCKDYSINKVGRKETSAHIDKGDGASGVDVKNKTFKTKEDYFKFLSCAIQAGFTGFGQGSKWVGAGTDTRLHIDTKRGTSGDFRSWTYGIKKH